MDVKKLPEVLDCLTAQRLSSASSWEDRVQGLGLYRVYIGYMGMVLGLLGLDRGGSNSDYHVFPE